MTKPHNHLGESPRHQSRRPSGAHPNRTANPRAGADTPRPLHPLETTVSTPSRTEGAATDRRPGQWPAQAHRPGHDDQLWLQLQAQRARRELILGSIAADLQEQPSPHAVRAAGRRWCRHITAMADDIATGADEGVSHR